MKKLILAFFLCFGLGQLQAQEKSALSELGPGLELTYTREGRLGVISTENDYFELIQDGEYQLNESELLDILGREKFQQLIELFKRQKSLQKNAVLFQMDSSRVTNVTYSSDRKKVLVTYMKAQGSEEAVTEVSIEGQRINFVQERSEKLFKIVTRNNPYMDQEIRQKMAEIDLGGHFKRAMNSGHYFLPRPTHAQIFIPWDGKVAILALIENGQFQLTLPQENEAVSDEHKTVGDTVTFPPAVLAQILGQEHFEEIRKMMAEDGERNLFGDDHRISIAGTLKSYGYNPQTGKIQVEFTVNDKPASIEISPVKGAMVLPYQDGQYIRVREINVERANAKFQQTVWKTMHERLAPFFNLWRQGFQASTDQNASKLFAGSETFFVRVDTESANSGVGSLNILSNGKIVLNFRGVDYVIHSDTVAQMVTGREYVELKSYLTDLDKKSPGQELPAVFLNLLSNFSFSVQNGNLHLSRKTALTPALLHGQEIQQIPLIFEVMMNEFDAAQVAIILDEKGNFKLYFPDGHEEEYRPKDLEILLGKEAVGKIREMIAQTIERSIPKTDIRRMITRPNGSIVGIELKNGHILRVENLPEGHQLLVMGDHLIQINLSPEKIEERTRLINENGVGLKVLEMMLSRQLKTQLDLEMKNPTRPMVKGMMDKYFGTFKKIPGQAAQFAKHESHTILLLMALGATHSVGPKIREYLDTGDPMALEQAYREVSNIVKEMPFSSALMAQIMGSQGFSHLVVGRVSKRLMPTTLAELVKLPFLAQAVSSQYITLGVFERSLLPELGFSRALAQRSLQPLVSGMGNTFMRPANFMSTMGRAVRPELLTNFILRQAMGFVAFFGWELGRELFTAVKKDMIERMRFKQREKIWAGLSVEERDNIIAELDKGMFVPSDLDSIRLENWWQILKNPEFRHEFMVSTIYCLINDEKRSEVFWSAIHSWSTWDLAATFAALGAGGYTGHSLSSMAARSTAMMLIRAGRASTNPFMRAVLPNAGRLMSRLGPWVAGIGSFFGVIAFATMKEFEVSRQAIYYLDKSLPFKPITRIQDSALQNALNIFYPEHNNASVRGSGVEMSRDEYKVSGWRVELGEYLGLDKFAQIASLGHQFAPWRPFAEEETTAVGVGYYVLDQVGRGLQAMELVTKKLDYSIAKEKMDGYSGHRDYMLKQHLLQLAHPLQSIYMELIKYSSIQAQDLNIIASSMVQKSSSGIAKLKVPHDFAHEACHLKSVEELLSEVDSWNNYGLQKHNDVTNLVVDLAHLPSDALLKVLPKDMLPELSIREKLKGMQERRDEMLWQPLLQKLLEKMPELKENAEVKALGLGVLTRERMIDFLKKTKEIILSQHPILEVTLKADLRKGTVKKTFAEILTQDLVKCDDYDLEIAFSEKNLPDTLQKLDISMQDYKEAQQFDAPEFQTTLTQTGTNVIKASYQQKMLEESNANEDWVKVSTMALQEMHHRLEKHKAKTEMTMKMIFGNKGDRDVLIAVPTTKDEMLYYVESAKKGFFDGVRGILQSARMSGAHRLVSDLEPEFVEPGVMKQIDFNDNKSEVLGDLEDHIENYQSAKVELLSFIRNEALRISELVDNKKEKLFVQADRTRVYDLLEEMDKTNTHLQDSFEYLLDWRQGSLGINGQKVGILMEWAHRLFKIDEFNEEMEQVISISEKQKMLEKTTVNLERLTMELENDIFERAARNDGIDARDEDKVREWITNVLYPDKQRTKEFLAGVNGFVKKNLIEYFKQDQDPENSGSLRRHWDRRVELRQEEGKKQDERQRVANLPHHIRLDFERQYERQHGRYSYQDALANPALRAQIQKEEQDYLEQRLIEDHLSLLIESNDLNVLNEKMQYFAQTLDRSQLDIFLKKVLAQVHGHTLNFTHKSRLIWAATRLMIMPAFERRMSDSKALAIELAKSWKEVIAQAHRTPLAIAIAQTSSLIPLELLTKLQDLDGKKYVALPEVAQRLSQVDSALLNLQVSTLSLIPSIVVPGQSLEKMKKSIVESALAPQIKAELAQAQNLQEMVASLNKWGKHIGEKLRPLIKSTSESISGQVTLQLEANWALAELALIIPEEIQAITQDIPKRQLVLSPEMRDPEALPMTQEQVVLGINQFIRGLETADRNALPGKRFISVQELAKYRDVIQPQYLNSKVSVLLADIEFNKAFVAISVLSKSESHWEEYFEDTAMKVLPKAAPKMEDWSTLPPGLQERMRARMQARYEEDLRQVVERQENLALEISTLGQGLWVMSRVQMSLGDEALAQSSSAFVKLVLKNRAAWASANEAQRLEDEAANKKRLEEHVALQAEKKAEEELLNTRHFNGQKYSKLVEEYQAAMAKEAGDQEEENQTTSPPATQRVAADVTLEPAEKFVDIVGNQYTDWLRRLSRFKDNRDAPISRPGDGHGLPFNLKTEMRVGGEYDKKTRGNPLIRQETVIADSGKLILGITNSREHNDDMMRSLVEKISVPKADPVTGSRPQGQ